MRGPVPLRVLDRDGLPVADAEVTVRVRDSEALADIHEADVGEDTIGNPQTTDAYGRVPGWLEQGAYRADVVAATFFDYSQSFDVVAGRDGALSSSHLAAGAVGQSELAAGAVVESKIAADQVTTAKFADDAVASADRLADGSVGASELADGAVTVAKLQPGIRGTGKYGIVRTFDPRVAGIGSFSWPAASTPGYWQYTSVERYSGSGRNYFGAGVWTNPTYAGYNEPDYNHAWVQVCQCPGDPRNSPSAYLLLEYFWLQNYIVNSSTTVDNSYFLCQCMPNEGSGRNTVQMGWLTAGQVHGANISTVLSSDDVWRDVSSTSMYGTWQYANMDNGAFGMWVRVYANDAGTPYPLIMVAWSRIHVDYHYWVPEVVVQPTKTLYARVYETATISSVVLRVVASAGNVAVAAYNTTGTGRAARPNVRQATSGSVAAPAAGDATVGLGTSITVSDGTWLSLSVNHSGLTYGSSHNEAWNRDAWGLNTGLALHESVFPAPSAATASPGTTSAAPLLIGA